MRGEKIILLNFSAGGNFLGLFLVLKVLISSHFLDVSFHTDVERRGISSNQPLYPLLAPCLQPSVEPHTLLDPRILDSRISALFRADFQKSYCTLDK